MMSVTKHKEEAVTPPPPKDGGQAFPHLVGKETFDDVKPVPGMSLLDWFAGQALKGMLASGNVFYVDVPKRAYELAQLMIKEKQNIQK
jgi:hypothetical protein